MMSFAAIQNRNGALYCLTIISFMAGSITSMHSFRMNRAMFLREFRCGYYTTAPYLASKLLAGLPFIVLFSSLQLTVTYFLIGFQNDARKLFVLLCTCCLLSLIGIAIGALIATITLLFEKQQASLVDNISLFSPFIFFSSLYVNFDSTTPVLYWIKWLNPVQYGFDCLMKNEYNGFLLQLKLDGVMNIIAGETIIKQQGLSPERLDVTNSLAILLCMTLCLLFAVFWTLKRIGNEYSFQGINSMYSSRDVLFLACAFERV
ncbi:hypothetical protein BCR33DRAFT_94165 [Rhizoclosmatium globosum]|uniref:ABC-2 type transporter transmembrane domain-containing protein n=1 Tax=Rhizoclosmatium globosum TaxID=329046 RepID=A0A1Y2CKE2_9FUNG|nr:hypothetical protein BCR33DRAFT_94165 [Rhizoclosmatium globosum]|eukprot:ORY47324.1 hypothetical protein BCR33DRAFT_94165 [Rhizoclosmatium globosum]